ncbi:MAG: type I methionyl aminopeptidase [Holosporales bacterium]|jgi:methionyl aminopeptidase|nr:type I methionyl aminopeptidase [Holosporales bacterium]
MKHNIKICDKNDLEKMRKAGRFAKMVLDYIEPYIKIDITTDELNTLCHDFIVSHGAVSATLNYNGFPKSICTSVNDVICHGIPGKYALKSGDIINVDVTVILDGWHGDTSRTFLVGNCSKLAQNLIEIAKRSLFIGIDAVKPYGHFGDIGKAIQKFVDKYGFSIVRDYCGHGIGNIFHSAPNVLHYDAGEKGPQILPGMFFTIEPMINAGSHKSKLLKDGWTVTTTDKSLSAQFEHTIAVGEDFVEVLTL